ncbi:MAG: GGDEF domain-containing protein [Pseudomonadota bacterium]
MISNAQFDAPQIEVLAERPRLDMLLSKLAVSGFRPLRADRANLSISRLPLFIDCEADTELAWGEIASPNRSIVFLSPNDATRTQLSDALFVSRLTELSGLRERLALRRRANLRDDEDRIRRETLAAFGEPLQSIEDNRSSPPAILYVGEINRHFTALKNGLEDMGLKLSACLSMAMAARHVETGTWRGIVLDPTLLIGSPAHVTEMMEDHADLFLASLSTNKTGTEDLPDILDDRLSWSDGLDVIARRVSKLAGQSPLVARSLTKLTSRVFDPATGLLTGDFFKAHLERQVQSCRAGETPLTILNLRLRNAAVSEMKPLADSLTGRLRTTDLACRHGKDCLLISLRDTNYVGAARLANRLIQGAPPQLQDRLLWRVSELRDGQTSDGLVATALNGPYSRPIAA